MVLDCPFFPTHMIMVFTPMKLSNIFMIKWKSNCELKYTWMALACESFKIVQNEKIWNPTWLKWWLSVIISMWKYYTNTLHHADQKNGKLSYFFVEKCIQENDYVPRGCLQFLTNESYGSGLLSMSAIWSSAPMTCILISPCHMCDQKWW